MPRPFEGRIRPEPVVVTEPESKAVRCSCSTSPWCRGPLSQEWASCSHTCRSYNPRRRRRPVANAREGEHAAAD
jgi:hypothetical protein